MASVKSSEALKTLTANLESRETKIKALDLSSELLKIKHEDGEIDKEDFAERYLTILKQRAKLGKVTEDFYSDTIPPSPRRS